MTYNIRYGTAKDGENHWSTRREMLFDVLREQDADLIGLQEALDFQIREIVTGDFNAGENNSAVEPLR